MHRLGFGVIMTRKDYVLIAEVLADHSANLPDGLVFDLCAALKRDNRRFNPGYFNNAIFDKEEV